MILTKSQSAVEEAIARSYHNYFVRPIASSFTTVNIMGLLEDIVIISTDVPAEPAPDTFDPGQRVRFRAKGGNEWSNGIVVAFKDLNDTVGVVFDGERQVQWKFSSELEII